MPPEPNPRAGLRCPACAHQSIRISAAVTASIYCNGNPPDDLDAKQFNAPSVILTMVCEYCTGTFELAFATIDGRTTAGWLPDPETGWTPPEPPS